ncbi:hypothetical protein NO559_00630 [Dasania sp. GY-MA-18]|uniref:Uncharacterized protein n=1 Tax=Dasania phycosphaerae TaxID=2950436 RepID=A0A9J6RH59_9GAMM|nr:MULTISPECIES: hypothetical protein [Dasania]MCR8921254.1 hypothetical protein [Dasania sp. GY-MA-18]MCZ0863682.1 hypothetical protein [Dasania phycosphaerae]MCZ0867410.1 hypothetical protein [Dasania phycosphaerae]
MPAPESLQDAKKLLTENGFAVADTWYHGTSSALLESILSKGLNRSGDKAIKQAAKQTMATIGNAYTETIEPVFLTQSKELAYYWAEQAVKNRAVRFAGEETPVVLAVKLPAELNAAVKPDVGAASLLMTKEGEGYMAFITSLYDSAGLAVPAIDLMKADRMDYLNLLGMAYYNKDIAAEFVTELQ